jgi:hypothetical protein
MKAIAFAVSSLLSVYSAAAQPAGVDLAALDGWDIVVAPDAIASEVYAAEEFRDHLVLAGGPKLPIMNQAGRPDRHIFVGTGVAMRRSAVGFDTEAFGPEDLRIVVRDGNIAIAGGRPRGTLYGVYTFLEDYLGVRFVAPDQTHVPPLSDWRKVGPVDRFYHPPLDWRWVGYEANYAHPEFAARLRLNCARLDPPLVGSKDWSKVDKYGGRSSLRLVEHTFNELLPPASYADDHPEYYCLWRGKRMANAKYDDGRFREDLQPCLTHPEVRRILTQGALDKLAASPGLLNVAVSQNDGSIYCECPNCAAIDEREGTPMGSVLTLVNQVADAVARAHPDRMVGTLAYDYSAQPPKSLRPRDNVQIMWCATHACLIHELANPNCPLNTGQLEQLREWSGITDNLYVWTYNLNHDRRGFQLPLPNLRRADRNIRTTVSLGVRGMFMQACSSSHGNEFEGLRNYMLSRLIWDPTLDGRRLMDEWLDLYYGRAAPPICRWFDRLHDRAEASGKHRRTMGGRYDEYGLDQSDVQFGGYAVTEAMRLADSEVIRQRVEQASIWAYRAALEPVWYTQADGSVDPRVAAQMRPIAKRFFELSHKHGVSRTASGSYFDLEKSEQRLRGLIGNW